MKAQVSVETVILIGLATALLLPAMYIFYEFLVKSTRDIQDIHVTRLGESIVENSNKMWAYGNRARTEIKLTFPENILNMSVDNLRVLAISANTAAGTRDYTFLFNHDVNASFTESDWQPGIKTIKFETRGDQVFIATK